MSKTTTILGAAVGLLVMAGSAWADGMTTDGPVISSCGGGRFNGRYIGASVGTTTLKSETTEQIIGGLSLLNENRTGISGGLQAGYNKQCGAALYGIEGDFNLTSLKDTTDYNLLGLFGGVPLLSDHRSLDWYSTLRTRAGIVANDSLLLYVTGGLAFAGMKHSVDALGGFNVFSERKCGGAGRPVPAPKWRSGTTGRSRAKSSTCSLPTTTSRFRSFRPHASATATRLGLHASA